MLSTAFKNDLASKNTQIIPLVIIEKFTGSGFAYHRLSTNAITLQGTYFTPLLKDSPSVSKSIDMFSRKYTISNTTVKIHDGMYDGKRFSTYQDDYVFIGLRVHIYYKTQNTPLVVPTDRNSDGSGWNTSRYIYPFSFWSEEQQAEFSEIGSYKVFTGFIRKVKILKDVVTLSIEDETQTKLKTKLPRTRLPHDSSVPEKYKNAIIPMTYGRYFHEAPAVGYHSDSGLTFKVDDKEILSLGVTEGISTGSGDSIAFVNGTMSVWDEKWIKLNNYIENIDTPAYIYDSAGDETPNKDYYDRTKGFYDAGVGHYPQLTISDDLQTCTLLSNSLFGVKKRVQGVVNGTPQDIVLNRVDTELTTESEAQLLTEDMLEDFHAGQEMLLHTSTEIIASDWGNVGGPPFYNTPVFSLQWDNSLGYELCRPIHQVLNGVRIPTRGDAHFPGSGLGRWDGQYGWIECRDLTQNVYGETGTDINALGHSHTSGNSVSSYDIDFYEWHAIQAEDEARIFHTTTDLEIESFVGFYSSGWAFETHGLTEQPPDAFQSYYGSISDMVDNLGEDIFFSYKNYAPSQNVIPWFRFVMGRDKMLRDYEADGVETAYPIVGEHWTSMELWCYNKSHEDNPLGGNDEYNPQIGIYWNMTSLKTTSIVEIKDAHENDFSLYVEGGRIDETLHGISHAWEYDINDDGEVGIGGATGPVDIQPQEANDAGHPDKVIEYPVSIMRNILSSELAFETYLQHFNEEEYSYALRCAWYSALSPYYKFKFSVNEEIEAGALLTELAFFGDVIPVVRPSGEWGFIPINHTYNYHMHYLWDIHPGTEGKVIFPQDVVSYNFDFEGNVFTKVEASYEKNYASGEYPKRGRAISLGSAGTTHPMREFYGLRYEDDNPKHIEHKFSRGINNTDLFSTFHFNKNHHKNLTAKLKLSLSYIHLDLGNLVHFPKDELLGGIKSHGIDYTNPVIYGGVFRYPIFMVTKVSIKKTFIEVSLFQMHSSSYQDATILPEFFGYDSIGDTGWNRDNFPNLNFVDPMGVSPPGEGDDEDEDGYCYHNGELLSGMSEAECTALGSDEWWQSYPSYGCTDTDALNYDPSAMIEDGSCIYAPSTDVVNDIDSFQLSTILPTNNKKKIGFWDYRGDGTITDVLWLGSAQDNHHDMSGWEDLFGPDRWSFGSNYSYLIPFNFVNPLSGEIEYPGLTSTEIKNFCAIEIILVPVQFDEETGEWNYNNDDWAFSMRLENVLGSEHSSWYDWSNIFSGELQGDSANYPGLVGGGTYPELEGFSWYWDNWNYQSILYNGEELGDPWDNYMNWHDTGFYHVSETFEDWHEAVSTNEISLAWVLYQPPPGWSLPYHLGHENVMEALMDGEWSVADPPTDRKRVRYGTYYDINQPNGNYQLSSGSAGHPYRVRQNRGYNFKMSPPFCTGEGEWSYGIHRYVLFFNLYPDYTGAPTSSPVTITYTSKGSEGGETGFNMFEIVDEGPIEGGVVSPNTIMGALSQLESKEDNSLIKRIKLLKNTIGREVK